MKAISVAKRQLAYRLIPTAFVSLLPVSVLAYRQENIPLLIQRNSVDEANPNELVLSPLFIALVIDPRLIRGCENKCAAENAAARDKETILAKQRMAGGRRPFWKIGRAKFGRPSVREQFRGNWPGQGNVDSRAKCELFSESAVSSLEESFVSFAHISTNKRLVS